MVEPCWHRSKQQPFIIPTLVDEYDLQQTKIETFEGSHRLTLRPAGDGEVRLFGISLKIRVRVFCGCHWNLRSRGLELAQMG